MGVFCISIHWDWTLQLCAKKSPGGLNPTQITPGQLSKAETGGELDLSNKCITIGLHCQMVFPEIIHTNSIMRPEMVLFIYLGTHICKNKEKEAMNLK